MLLHGGVGGAGNDLAHRLAAADDRDTCVLNFGNDVAAMLANVNFCSMMILLSSLIILRVNFKVALGMVAGRADLGRLLTDHDMTAVAALPHLGLRS